MKTCSKCKQKKKFSEFSYKNTENRYSHMCKQCFSKYCMDRWTKRKLEAIKYKGGKCSRCGYSKYYGALEFHHVDPLTKKFTWNKMRLLSKDKMFAELDKCILVCSNCHKELHKK